MVDDEPANLLLLEEFLSDTATEVYSTTDPREVEQAFKDFQPDIVLLDLHMPEVDGREILRRLRGPRDSLGFLPVVVLTGDTSRAARNSAFLLGANDFLTKPLDKTEVVLRVPQPSKDARAVCRAGGGERGPGAGPPLGVFHPASFKNDDPARRDLRPRNRLPRLPGVRRRGGAGGAEPRDGGRCAARAAHHDGRCQPGRRISARAVASGHGFNKDLTGADGFVMPATQHDAVMWISGSAYDVVFDMAREVIAGLAALATVAEETSSWPYRHDRDLTGFIDGTENPTLIEAPSISLIPDGNPGAGGSVLLLQKWIHDATAWELLSVDRQERVIGRRKDDSAELPDKPSDSHVARTDQDTFGKVFRRNMPFGTVTAHGTMFVGFSSEQPRLAKMLASMGGAADGVRDTLTIYTRATSGAYYFIPSTDALRRLSGS